MPGALIRQADGIRSAGMLSIRPHAAFSISFDCLLHLVASARYS